MEAKDQKEERLKQIQFNRLYIEAQEKYVENLDHMIQDYLNSSPEEKASVIENVNKLMGIVSDEYDDYMPDVYLEFMVDELMSTRQYIEKLKRELEPKSEYIC